MSCTVSIGLQSAPVWQGSPGFSIFRRLPPHRNFCRVDSKGHSRFVLRILIIPSHRSRKTARVSASCLKPSVATTGAFSKRGPFCRLSLGAHGQLKPPSIFVLENPGAIMSQRTFATRLVDSKGHSRFVLRILIILSHWSRKARGSRFLLAGSRG